MIDAIAIVALVLGGLLSLIGSIGLLRFPDAFTRMHAAAKAATLGVILATVAASLEATGFGAVALLILVVGLLFLSAPLGTSLLARAAYHDPDTPRLQPVRDDLAATGASAEPIIDDRPGTTGLLAGWLLVVWVSLFATGTAGSVVGAVVVAVAVSVMLPGYRPRWPRGIFKPLAAARFALTFVATLVVSNFEVALAVLRRADLRPAVLEMKLRVATATETTLLMNVLTFTPGTIALELAGDRLYLHVLDLTDETVFRRRFEDIETRIIAAFGTAGERLPADG